MTILDKLYSFHIEEIPSRNSFLFGIGLEYLLSKRPENIPMIACYEGYATHNFSSGIYFEQTGTIYPHTDFFDRPQRFVFYEEVLQGVMVTISLPEFSQVTDAETYVIIEADSEQVYCDLLELTSSEEKVEVITFRSEHSEWTKKLSSISGIHHYKLLGFDGTECDNETNTNTRLANQSDFEWFAKLSEQIPYKAARSYFRALQFQLAGLPYMNFLSPVDGEPETLVCIRKNCSCAWQVHYVVSASANINNDLLASTLKHALSVAKKYAPIVIWRLKDQEYQQYSTVIDRIKFDLLTQEHHLHIDRQCYSS